ADTAAFRIHDAKIVLATTVALLGGLAIPLDGFNFILADTAAFRIHVAKIVLASIAALLGRLAIPLDGFLVVLVHAAAFRIHLAEIVLCGPAALLVRLAVPSLRVGLMLFADAAALLLPAAIIFFTSVVPLVGGLAIPLDGFGLIFGHAAAFRIHVAKT